MTVWNSTNKTGEGTENLGLGWQVEEQHLNARVGGGFVSVVTGGVRDAEVYFQDSPG